MTATQNLPTELIFKEINIGKSKTVKYYKFVNGNISNTPFKELLRISENRFFAKSNPIYWLSNRGLTKWETKPYLTGLFPTSTERVYFGDHNHKESLLIFDLTKPNILKVKFYDGYYPNYKAIKELLKQS